MDRIDFRPRADHLVSSRPIGEPHSFEMSIEAEVLDSVSGERLSALVENKIAPPNEKTTDTWRSINGALRQWAQLLRKALDEDRVQGS